ncbi:MAG: hypothetical protein ABIF40_03450 [archaeon]
MKHKTKSALIGRKKSDNVNINVRPCFISLFEENNPHLSIEGPSKVIEFEKVHKVIINNLKINYLLPGNDLVINDLEEIEVEQDGEHIHISGKHC